MFSFYFQELFLSNIFFIFFFFWQIGRYDIHVVLKAQKLAIPETIYLEKIQSVQNNKKIKPFWLFNKQLLDEAE